MRVALIPPIDYLWHTHQTDMQLMLPQLLGDSDYRNVYESHLSNPNQYVILDNGAAEYDQVSDEDLVAIVDDLFPQELAIPDVLADANATVGKAFNFLTEYADYFDNVPTKLGFVTQGRSVEEAVMSAQVMMESRWADQIEVFYIPRLLIRQSANIRARMNVAVQLEKYRREIHFFGAAPSFLEEVRLAAHMPFIRSIDTSAPFVRACYSTDMITFGGLDRPDNYFDVVFNPEQIMIAADNVNTYLRWAGMRR